MGVDGGGGFVAEGFGGGDDFGREAGEAVKTVQRLAGYRDQTVEFGVIIRCHDHRTSPDFEGLPGRE
jgi:hypothetical protein